MSRGTILVVEKDAFYSSFYEKLLTREGYRVVHAESIEDGLRRYREQPCEVVISDMVLGAEDGLTFLDAVKAANPRQDVVMITSMQSLRKAVEALKRGAADYLTKPVDGEELLLLLRTLIERQTMNLEHSRLVGENVLFYEQLRVHKRGLELLAMLETDRIIDHFLDLLIAETAAVWAALYFYHEDDDSFAFAARRGIHDVRLERPGTTFRTAALRDQFFRGRALLEDREGGQHPEGDAEGGHRFRLPLLVRAVVTGLVVVGPRRDDAPHRDYQVNVARVIAESGALALENARRYELEASRDVHDALTGTYSPVYFHQAGAKEVNIAHRYGRSMSAVVVQLDTYPAAKAALKETQARQLLKEFAAKILEIARETDVVAMLDEGVFGIIVPETDYYGALMLIKRLRGALRGMVFSIDLSRELKPRASMGAASYPRDGEQLVTILRRARERLVLDRASVVRTLGLSERSFWNAFAFLLGLEDGSAPAAARRLPDAHDGRGRPGAQHLPRGDRPPRGHPRAALHRRPGRGVRGVLLHRLLAAGRVADLGLLPRHPRRRRLDPPRDHPGLPRRRADRDQPLSALRHRVQLLHLPLPAGRARSLAHLPQRRPAPRPGTGQQTPGALPAPAEARLMADAAALVLVVGKRPRGPARASRRSCAAPATRWPWRPTGPWRSTRRWPRRRS